MPQRQSSITAILFDLDDTLNDRSASWARFAEEIKAAYGDRIAKIDGSGIHKAILVADRAGYRPKDELFGELCERLPWVDAPSAVELETFWRERFAGCMTERAGARSLLTDIRSGGLSLGIVTNGRTDMQTAKIRALGFHSMVDAVIISESVGVKKPDPRIFREAMGALGLAADGTVFVGDHPTLDVVGPAGVGMRTAWLKLDRQWPTEHRAPDYELSSLGDLREIIGLGLQV